MKLLALGLLFGAMALSAADVTGHWSGTFDFRTPDGGQRQSSVYLILKQDGAKVTGTGGRDLADRHDVTEGKIEGNTIVLEVEAGNSPFRLQLTLEGNQLTGDVTRARGDGTTIAGKVSATRAKDEK
jgi:hypothetical protein